MLLNTKYTQPQQSFTGFYKIKGPAPVLKPLAEKIKDTYPESFVFFADKSKYNRKLFILTDKHIDKFIKYVGKVDFMDLKKHVEKYIDCTAKKLKVRNVKKDLRDGKFKI